MPRKKQVFKCYKCKRDTFRDNHNLLQHVNICAKTAVQEPDDEHLDDSSEIVGSGPNLDRVEEMRDPGVAVHCDFDQVAEAIDATVASESADIHGRDFLSYLKSKFDDAEAESFFTSFALTLQGKNDEFCIDLDEAYKCMNYASKQKALDLVKKLKLKETVDFSLNRSVEPNSPDKYLLKPAAFKKLLLSARTKAAQKAAEYFIKIEEAIPEFYNQGGTTFTPPRASDWKALPIDAYTARLTYKKPEGMIVSAGYNEDMSDPKAYFMRSGECTYPPGLVPDGAMVIDFGQTSDSRKRRADYERKTGAGEFLEHFPSPDPVCLERAIRRIIIRFKYQQTRLAKRKPKPKRRSVQTSLSSKGSSYNSV